MNYIITSITRKDDKLEFVFNNKDVFLISRENYFRFDYLYEGKTLTEKEFKDLVSYESDEQYRKYIRGLVKKGLYSSYDLKQRLIEKKGLSYNDASRIIDDLKKEGYIDDDRYVENKLDALKFQLLSPKAIIQYFTYVQHIDKEIIDKYIEKINEIDEEDLLQKIDDLFTRHYDKPLIKRKEYALDYLAKKQYSLSFSNELIDTYIKDNSVEDEVSEEYEKKIFLKYLRKYKNYTLEKKKQYLYASLVKEGLDKGDILDMLDNLEGEEDEERAFVIADLYNKSNSLYNTTEKKIAYFTKKMTSLGYTLSAVKNIIKENGYDFE